MKISSNTLFHFTRDKQNLVGILTDGFKPRYCSEDMRTIHYSPYKNFMIPMVCFCDIPLSMIDNHIMDYGCYGIGMSKEWGVKKGINPIFYIMEGTLINSHINNIKNTLVDLWFSKEVKEAPSDELNNTYWNMLSYFKPYKGICNKSNAEKIFYEEREWRYVPPYDDNAHLITDSSDHRVDFNKMNDLVAKNHSLGFKISDIKYIIVQSKDEIYSILEDIDRIKSPRYDVEDVQILKTKIISVEDIREDF